MSPYRPAGTVIAGPAWKDGELVRAVVDGEDNAWPQLWDKSSSSWVPGASLRDVISGVPVDAAFGATKGIPPEAFIGSAEV